MLRPVHFEIHATDPEALKTFYQSVFGWAFQQYEDNPYWLVTTDETSDSDEPSSAPGINGGLMPRQGPPPQDDAPVNGWVVTIDVPNVSEYIKKIVDAGGSVALETMTMPGMGYVAYMKDPDRNIFGLYQDDPTAA